MEHVKSQSADIMNLEIIAGFVAPVYSERSGFPLLLCLYTGEAIPYFTEPMLRLPAPREEVTLDASFPQLYAKALATNFEVHDGAILAGRSSALSNPYVVRGWSYRLFPPSRGPVNAPNRGSAFHSCMAMSALPEIDGVILFARRERLIFVQGDLVSSLQIGSTEGFAR
jgi:hypothetical protein